jgi:hypothetical protein
MWFFEPKDSDVGIYNMSLISKIHLKGHPTVKNEYKFKVIIWNDPPKILEIDNDRKDELIFY